MLMRFFFGFFFLVEGWNFFVCLGFLKGGFFGCLVLVLVLVF